MGEIFISHASEDRVLAVRIAKGIELAGHSYFLDSDQENGIPPGATWQRTLLRELHICDAVVFLNSTAGQASMWCHSELVVATELGKQLYPFDLAPGLPPHPLLQSLQGIGFDPDIDDRIRRLTDRLELDGLAGNAGLRWERGRPPYPGLAAMDVADAGVFFGREDEVRDLIARVDGPISQRDGDLVVVIGPSGAGKSSLVRAGLAARLGAPRSGWAVASPFEPGTRPLDRLASRLAALVPGQLDAGECKTRLVSDGLAAFGEWLANQSEGHAKRLLIIVDQAEQLATVTPPAVGAEFLSVLGGGIEPGSPVTIVLTVRSDRFDEIQRLPAIGSLIHAPFVIAPMDQSRLATVIEGPAGRANLTFQPGLVSRLVADAARDGRREAADALPFLASVLREMYDLAVRDNNRAVLTEADYERAGRIDGAIARRTEAAEATLPPGGDLVLDRMLPRFVVLDEQHQPASRPVPSEQLTAAERAVVQRLQDQRLLVGTTDTVRLAHDQLITAWPRLIRVVAERRDYLVMQSRLERQAEDWLHGHGELLGRDATIDARSWLADATAPETVSTAVSEYVYASAEALRRERRRTRTIRSVIVVLVMIALVTAAVATVEGSHALSQTRLSQSEQMAAEAINLLPADGPLAMLVGLQAYERAPTIQAESALIEAAQQPLTDQLVAGSPVRSVAFSPDGRTVAAGDTPGHIRLWNALTGRRTASLREGILVDSLAFSPDGHVLAAGDYSGHVGLWNVATGRETILNEGILVYSVAFSPNGRTLAAGDFGGHVGLWNVATGRETATLNEGKPVYGVAFSPDGHTIAAGDAVGHVGLWNVATKHKTATLNEGSLVYSVAFSPNGLTLAAGDFGGHAGLWNVETKHKTATLNEGSPISGVAFSPDGHTYTLAAGDDSGDVDLWDAAPARRASVSEGSSVRDVAFSPDGRTLAAGDAGGHVGLWNTAAGRRTGYLNERHPVDSVAFSPDGRTLAVGDAEGHVGLWNAATGRRTGTMNEGEPVDSVAFSPDGHVIAAGDIGGHVGLWNVATRHKTATLNERVPVYSVAFSPDGHVIAAGDSSGGIGLWDVATRHKTATLNEGSLVYSVAFSPVADTLAASDNRGHVGLWNVETKHKTATLREGSLVYSVAFSPDGQILATSDDLGDVGIWNVAAGQQLARIAENDGAAELAFSPDGQLLAVGGLDGTIALVRQDQAELTLQHFMKLICGEVRHNMTKTQWAEYAPGQPYQQTCSQR